VALLRILVAPLVMDEAEDRLLAPEVESLVPIFGLLRQAPARLWTVERLYFDETPEGRRRLAALARVACAGLVSLLIPRLAPFLSLVDRQRKSWLPRFVNLEPSIPVELPEAGLEGLVPLFAGLPALMAMDRRETVIIVRVPSEAAALISLAAARSHRPSISPPFFIAHSSKLSRRTSGDEA